MPDLVSQVAAAGISPTGINVVSDATGKKKRALVGETQSISRNSTSSELVRICAICEIEAIRASSLDFPMGRMLLRQMASNH